MEKNYYEFNSSQDVIRLQTKYALYKRVQNILFYTVVDDGYDMDLMKIAINKLFERNDCLRIRFVDRDKKTYQYFEDKRQIDKIPYKEFDTESKFLSFMNKYRVKWNNVYKGKVLDVVFAKNYDGKQMIIFKISHYVADTYGIGVLVNDLFSVYKSLKEGTELPPMPGSFEEVLKKDMSFTLNQEAKDKELEFFRDLYYNKHPKHAVYCGIHGNRSDRWLKYKRKGYFHIPYLFVGCDTKGYRFIIPSSLTKQAVQWCQENSMTMSTFFLFTYSIATSLVNDRESCQMPLELLNSRATLTEKKAAGTKVQSISVYMDIDYDKSFNENIVKVKEEQALLYRHTKLTYMEVEKIFHKAWDFTSLSQLSSFCFSFIPVSNPDGIHLQVYSNGKGSLVDYVAMMYDINTQQINVVHDVQTKMISPEVMIDFHNLYLDVIEKVLEKPEEQLKNLF